MTNTTMVERVAEAMKARRLELIAQPLDRSWKDIAIAAIGAMRELPDDLTKLMYSVSGSSIAHNSAAYPANPPYEAWQAAIDAILKEHEEKGKR